MQFQVKKSSLLKILSNVSGAVERKNTIAILQNVKIDVSEGKVNFTTTDMDIVITSIIHDASIVSGGTTTVPAQLMLDIVKKIPNEAVIDFALQESEVLAVLKYGKSKFTLPCIDPVEFPVLSEGEMNQEFKVNAKEFARIIDKVRFAISNDDTRYYLNGLFIHALKNKEGVFELRSAATDGHRLATSVTIKSNLDSPIEGITIPKKTINEIRRIIENEDEIIVSLSKSKIMVKCSNCNIISKLIDGDFPDYSRLIPKENNKIVKINKKTIFEAIDRVSTIASDKHRTVKIILESGKVELQVSSNDGGFANEELEIDFNDEKIEAGFNSRYLLDIINQIDKEIIELKFNNNFSPVIIDCEDLLGLYVIMPVRI